MKKDDVREEGMMEEENEETFYENEEEDYEDGEMHGEESEEAKEVDSDEEEEGSDEADEEEDEDEEIDDNFKIPVYDENGRKTDVRYGDLYTNKRKAELYDNMNKEGWFNIIDVVNKSEAIRKYLHYKHENPYHSEDQIIIAMAEQAKLGKKAANKEFDSIEEEMEYKINQVKSEYDQKLKEIQEAQNNAQYAQQMQEVGDYQNRILETAANELNFNIKKYEKEGGIIEPSFLNALSESMIELFPHLLEDKYNPKNKLTKKQALTIMRDVKEKMETKKTKVNSNIKNVIKQSGAPKVMPTVKGKNDTQTKKVGKYMSETQRDNRIDDFFNSR